MLSLKIQAAEIKWRGLYLMIFLLVLPSILTFTFSCIQNLEKNPKKAYLDKVVNKLFSQISQIFLDGNSIKLKQRTQFEQNTLKNMKKIQTKLLPINDSKNCQESVDKLFNLLNI